MFYYVYFRSLFLTIDLTKTKLLLNLDLESFVIQAIELNFRIDCIMNEYEILKEAE